MEEFYKIYESINVLKFFMPGILLILIPNYILYENDKDRLKIHKEFEDKKENFLNMDILTN